MAPEKTNFSVRVDTDLLNEVDRNMKKAQGNGDLPLDYNRSKAVRSFLRAAAEDPDVLVQFADPEE